MIALLLPGASRAQPASALAEQTDLWYGQTEAALHTMEVVTVRESVRVFKDGGVIQKVMWSEGPGHVVEAVFDKDEALRLVSVLDKGQTTRYYFQPIPPEGTSPARAELIAWRSPQGSLQTELTGESTAEGYYYGGMAMDGYLEAALAGVLTAAQLQRYYSTHAYALEVNGTPMMEVGGRVEAAYLEGDQEEPYDGQHDRVEYAPGQQATVRQQIETRVKVMDGGTFLLTHTFSYYHPSGRLAARLVRSGHIDGATYKDSMQQYIQGSYAQEVWQYFTPENQEDPWFRVQFTKMDGNTVAVSWVLAE